MFFIVAKKFNPFPTFFGTVRFLICSGTRWRLNQWRTIKACRVRRVSPTRDEGMCDSSYPHPFKNSDSLMLPDLRTILLCTLRYVRTSLCFLDWIWGAHNTSLLMGTSQTTQLNCPRELYLGHSRHQYTLLLNRYTPLPSNRWLDPLWGWWRLALLFFHQPTVGLLGGRHDGALWPASSGCDLGVTTCKRARARSKLARDIGEVQQSL